LITAAMFLTGMAANPLVVKAARDILGVELTWGTWALGAIVPGLCGLALLPWLIHWLERPTIEDTHAAQKQAQRDLDEMGSWSRDQLIMAGLFVALLVLWSTKAVHGMGSGLVAWVGVMTLLLTKVDSWDDVIRDARAWDTLFWLGGLLALANALKSEGVVDWFAEAMQSQMAGIEGISLALVLAIIYFYSMYGFSMLTAHIAAFTGAFFAVAAAGGAPAMVCAALFAYFSNLCACTTPYSTGPVVIYFGLGYVRIGPWFRTGFIVSVFHMAIWLGVGLTWWRVLGWW